MLPALLAALALGAAAVPPGAWEPFTSRREVSPGGRHYVVLRARADGSVEFELARRREGVPPIAPARALPVTADPALPRPVLDRDPADPVLARGLLPQPPFQVRVLDGEPAVVLFERYGALGSGDALALLGGDGRIRWRLPLSALLRPEAVASFPRVEGDLWWFQAWWVDEARGRAVVAAAGDLFAEADLADGTVRAAGPGILLTRLLEGPEEDRVEAWDLAARLLPEGVAGAARKVDGDPGLPAGIRVRAALALKRLDPRHDAGPAFRAAAARGSPVEVRAFANRWLPAALGQDALPILRDALRGEADGAWRPALAGLADLGEKAVPTLVEMLGEKDQSLDYRGGAAHVLAALKPERALPALWKAALEFDPENDPHHFVPGAALDAVVDIGPPDLRARLLDLLDRGTPHDGRIAAWIEAHPGKDALPALGKALGRWDRFSWERQRIKAAMRACGG